MTTEYIVWIQIEECELDGEDYDRIVTVGEPRQAGRFETERLACEYVEDLLGRADAATPRIVEDTEERDFTETSL